MMEMSATRKQLDASAVDGMLRDVSDFHIKFGFEPFKSLNHMPDTLVKFRELFIVEEATEIFWADAEANWPGLLDGFIDLAYVAIGNFYLSGSGVSWQYDLPRPMLMSEFSDLSDGVQKPSWAPSYTLGLANSCRQQAIIRGWNFDAGWNRVHAANISKVRAVDKSGKRKSTWDVVKPEGWVAPDLSDLV